MLAGPIAAAAGFLVVKGIFADEHAFFLCLAIGILMMMLRPEHALRRKPKKPAP